MLLRPARTNLRAPPRSTEALLNRRLPDRFANPVSCTKTVIQHVSNANPHGTERFKDTTALDMTALKTPPAGQIRVSSKLHNDNHSPSFKC